MVAATKKAASAEPVNEDSDDVKSNEVVIGDTTAKVSQPDAGHLTDNVLKPGHDNVPHYKSGFAVEKAFYNNPEPAAHARPADLDPRTNGPFLDEIRTLEAANTDNSKIHDEFMSVVNDHRESEAKANQ